jgi:4-amino-4-deoxy-L-arabinose transferase-like glycosyltransferase
LWQPIKSCWHRWRSGGTVSGASPANAELLFCCWSLATLLFFSASMTKLQTYVLPAWPAMAVLVGVVLDRWFERPDESRRRYLYGCAQLLGLLGMAMMIVTLAALAFAVNPAQMATLVPAPVSIKLARLADSIDNWQRAAIVGCAGVTAVGFLISWRRLQLDEPRRGITALFATCMAADAIGSPVAYQLGYRYKNADVHAVVQSIRNEPGLVALYHDFKPSVIFHLKRPVDTFFSVDQLRRRTTQNDPHQRQYIIAAGKGASELLSAYPADLRVIARSGNWSVMATDSLVAVRLPTLEQSFTQHIDLSGGEYSWGTLPFAGGTKPPRL